MSAPREALERIAGYEYRADRRHRGMVDASELENVIRIARVALRAMDAADAPPRPPRAHGRSKRHGPLCPPRFVDGDGRRVKPDRVTCGTCDRSWCYRCEPTPAYLCPWCAGAGHSEAALPPEAAPSARKEG